MRCPWMQTVTLPQANQNLTLYSLMSALDSSVLRHCQALQVQLDQSAGGAMLFIGNPLTMTSTSYGVMLVASQAFSIPSLSSNLLLLDDIAVRSDTGGVRVNVVAITR